MARFPAEGDTFGNYIVQRRLGSGGMGAVFAARHSVLGRQVALKVLLPSFADDETYRARFTREATALASIDSPHIVQIYEFGEIDDCLFIATQYVAGGDVAELVKRHGPLSAKSALTITANLAWALDDAHRAGVIHRDVKPANVLIRDDTTDEDPYAYLCDFGIALSGDASLTRTGEVAGSFAYLSPERLDGREATVKSDIYALGGVLWHLLTGERPSPTVFEPGVFEDAPDLAAFLRRCMARDPQDRFASMAPVRAELAALAESIPNATEFGAGTVVRRPWSLDSTVGPAPAAGPIGDPESPDRIPTQEEPPTIGPQARRTRIAAVLTSLLLIGGAASAGLWWVNRDSSDPGSGVPVVQVPPPADVTLQTGRSVLGPGPTSLLADFTGDGRDDLALLGMTGESLVISVFPSVGDGFSSAQNWISIKNIDAGAIYPLAADLDNDGIDDLVLLAGTTSVTPYVMTSTGATFNKPVANRTIDSPLGSLRPQLADVTGDGQADLVLPTQSAPGREPGVRVTVMPRLGDDFAVPEEWMLADGWTLSRRHVMTGDFNRDGLQDLATVGQPQSGVEMLLYLSSGNQFGKPERWRFEPEWSWNSLTPAAGDFNGNGRDDLVELGAPPEGGADLMVMLSTGSELSTPEQWWRDLRFNRRGVDVLAGDLTGDKRADVVMVYSRDGLLVAEVLQSTGSGFTRGRALAPQNWSRP